MLASEDRGIDGKIARSPARTKLKGILGKQHFCYYLNYHIISAFYHSCRDGLYQAFTKDYVLSQMT
jgi:hypothetical protein